MPQRHDDKSQAARDALLERITKQAPNATKAEIKALAEAYRAVMEFEPPKPGRAAGV